MKSITFATNNKHKVREVNEMLEGKLIAGSLKDINCTEDIAETSPTIEGNALQKARYVYENYQVDVFAEDTGLEVDALNGDPGVHTARYAGEHRDNDDNIDLVLKNLEDKNDRGAQFKTVIALILDGKEYTFEGICRGTIAHTRQGTGGFGYDPVFIPVGHTTSFAEMSTEAKNEISHRGIATRKLMDFLKEV
jgi:XTP/dITP diphosphohydrolase